MLRVYTYPFRVAQYEHTVMYHGEYPTTPMVPMSISQAAARAATTMRGSALGGRNAFRGAWVTGFTEFTGNEGKDQELLLRVV